MTQTFEQWAESEGLDMSVDWKGDLTSPVTAGALRGWEAAQSAGQEAIYQARVYGGWDDVSRSEFEQIEANERPKRIVYAAPVNGGERAIVDAAIAWADANPDSMKACAALVNTVAAYRGERAADAPQVSGDVLTFDQAEQALCAAYGRGWRATPATFTAAAKVGGDEREALKHPLERYVGLVIELLEDARSILLRGWARGATARDDKGSPVSANCVNVACAWSLLGALDVAGVNLAKRLTDGKTFGESDAARHSVNNIAYQIATELVADETDLCAGYPAQRLDQWNNNSSRTAEEVFAALDRALGRLQTRAALPADGGEDKRDAERLDFMIEQQAWVQWTVRDGSIRQCQVYTQDEDENYHILSGEDQFFSTPREAIDAAIAANQAKGE